MPPRPWERTLSTTHPDGPPGPVRPQRQGSRAAGVLDAPPTRSRDGLATVVGDLVGDLASGLSGGRSRRPPRELLRWLGFVGLAAAATAIVVGLVLRFVASSELWLDEAQSVAIARGSVPELVAALREDGSPPLYYLLLHGWQLLFGSGNGSVRSLSGLFSVAALPSIWLLGRRLAPERGDAALPALLLLATSPFAVRYATETRMYSLVILLTALGGLALLRVLDRPRPLPVIGLGLASGLLTLTHYWALFLLIAVGLVLLAGVALDRRRWASGWALLGMCSGGLLLVPWLPSLLFQLQHTGTPWTEPVNLPSVARVYIDWAGPTTLVGPLLAVALLGLAVIGAAALPSRGGELRLDLKGRPWGRVLVWLCVGPLVVAYVVGQVAAGGYAARYTAVMFLPFILLAARGIALLPGRFLRSGVLAVAVILGLLSSSEVAAQPRTAADQIASALTTGAEPGDLVVYCPDQLAPDVKRLFDQQGVGQATYPTFGLGQRVDWVDYASRNEVASGPAFAREASSQYSGAVWLLWAPGYRTFGRECEQLADTLLIERPDYDEVELFGPEAAGVRLRRHLPVNPLDPPRIGSVPIS